MEIKKIVFLYRARGEFWSIEELFNCIAEAMPPSVECFKLEAPKAGAKFWAIFFNLIWSSRVNHGDVIHITGDIHYAAVGIWKAPTVLTIHDLRFIEESRGIRGKLLWLLWLYLPAKRATQITVISEFTKQRLLSSVRIPQKKITVIPDCVTPEFRACAKPELSNPPVVLHVGTTPNKNLERLADACSGLNLILWILGRLTADQKRYLSARSINYREHFNLKRSDVVELYERCDIVSFVSLYEGFGLPILEGQAVGRPVLTSNIPPMNEVSGGAALHVDPSNVLAIRTAIEALIQDSSLRAQLAENGFENVRKYSAAAVASKYFELYQRILAQRL